MVPTPNTVSVNHLMNDDECENPMAIENIEKLSDVID